MKSHHNGYCYEYEMTEVEALALCKLAGTPVEIPMFHGERAIWNKIAWRCNHNDGCVCALPLGALEKLEHLTEDDVVIIQAAGIKTVVFTLYVRHELSDGVTTRFEGSVDGEQFHGDSNSVDGTMVVPLELAEIVKAALVKGLGNYPKGIVKPVSVEINLG